MLSGSSGVGQHTCTRLRLTKDNKPLSWGNSIEETLTHKPDNFQIRAMLREGITATDLERRMAGAASRRSRCGWCGPGCAGCRAPAGSMGVTNILYNFQLTFLGI